MTTSLKRAMVLFIGVAIPGVPLTGADPAGAQGCTPQFLSNGAAFVSSLCGMPDYDQRRTAATLTGDGRSINLNTIGSGTFTRPLDLQGNGGCHCVPTSFSNLLGYYTGKGVTGNFPRRFEWDNRAGYVARPDVAPDQYLNGQPYPAEEVTAYSSTTFAIRTLGRDVTVGNAGCGTNWGTVLNYHKQFRSLFPKVTMSVEVVSPEAMAPKQVANILAMGGTVSVAYGRYANYSESNGKATWGTRGGGHAVTVRKVSSAGGNTATLEISDPARLGDINSGDDDRDYYRQSVTAPLQVLLTRVTNEGQDITRWRWSKTTTSGNQAIWDSMLIAIPLMAVTANGGTVQWFPGWAFNNTGTPSTEFAPKSFRLGGTVLDAAVLPATGEIAYIRRGDDSVRSVAVGTGERRVIGPAPKGAAHLEPDPTGRQIYVAGTSELVQMNPEGEILKKVNPPSTIRALTFDPGSGLGTGRLIAIGADRGLRRFAPETLSAVGSAKKLPVAILQGSGPLTATVDTKGQLFVRRGSSDRIGRVGLATRKVGRVTIGGLRGDGGLQISDRGTLFTIIGGKLTELTPGAAAAPNSPLTGRRTRGRVLQITRSGSDVPAALADQIIDERVVDPAYPEMAP